LRLISYATHLEGQIDTQPFNEFGFGGYAVPL